MLVFTVPLGTIETLTPLFSYPNIPGDGASLIDTISHWFAQTLDRDGLTALGATFNVQPDGAGYSLHLIGPPPISNFLLSYVSRLPQFLQNGWGAYSGAIPALQAAKNSGTPTTTAGDSCCRSGWRWCVTGCFSSSTFRP